MMRNLKLTSILNDIVKEEGLGITFKGVIYDPFDREESHKDEVYHLPNKKYMTLKNMIFTAHVLNNMDYRGIISKTETPALIKIIRHILPTEKPKMVERVAVALKELSNYWWIFYGITE